MARRHREVSRRPALPFNFGGAWRQGNDPGRLCFSASDASRLRFRLTAIVAHGRCRPRYCHGKTRPSAVTQWITAAAQEHGQGLPEHVMARLGISRRSALALLNKLVTTQWLAREGKSRHLSFVPGSLRQVVQRYALAGLQEDLPWQRDFVPHFSLPPAVARMAQYALSE